MICHVGLYIQYVAPVLCNKQHIFFIQFNNILTYLFMQVESLMAGSELYSISSGHRTISYDVFMIIVEQNIRRMANSEQEQLLAGYLLTHRISHSSSGAAVHLCHCCLVLDHLCKDWDIRMVVADSDTSGPYVAWVQLMCAARSVLLQGCCRCCLCLH